MRDKKNGIRFHFIGQPQYWPPPFPFSIKSESQHYPSDGLISLCAVMQTETEYQIRFNINLSWKRCICMKQKTAFHDYSFSDKIFIAAHIRSWVSHEAFLNLMSDFACEIYSQFLCSLKFDWRKKLHKIKSFSIENGILVLVYKSITKLKPGFRFLKVETICIIAFDSIWYLWLYSSYH